MGIESWGGSKSEALPEDAVEKEPEEIAFPNGDAAVAAYLEKYANQPERAELIRKVFQEFLKEELDNTAIFKSESGIEMPYTSIRVGKLARRIYKEILGKELLNETEKEGPLKKQKFVFGTSPITEDGDQFGTVEFSMHDTVRKLRTILPALEKGESSEDEEIFTIGMPTNVLGRIPPELVEKIKASPSDELGKVYAELIAQKIKEGGDELKIVELLGMSLGASLAVRIGESLIDRRVVTQDSDSEEDDNLPRLHIRAEVPVAMGPSKIKTAQIYLGFVTDGILEMQRPDFKRIGAGKAKFVEKTRALLAERGIDRQMSPEQKAAKQSVIRSIVWALKDGLTPRPETKVTEVYGLNDATSVTPSMRRAAKKQREGEAKGSLGEVIWKPRKGDSAETDNRRKFGVKMLHMNPWFRSNELKRLNALAEELQLISK